MSELIDGKLRRKSLGDQLDRLDGILDLLAAGLPQAVADAARAGTRDAVRAALAEVLADPNPRPLVPGQKPRAEPRARPRPRPRPALVALGRRARRVLHAAYAPWRATRALATAGGTFAGGPVPARRITAVTVCAGLLGTGLTALAPVALAGVLAGFGCSCAALTVQLAVWVGRGLPRPVSGPAAEPDPAPAGPESVPEV